MLSPPFHNPTFHAPEMTSEEGVSKIEGSCEHLAAKGIVESARANLKSEVGKLKSETTDASLSTKEWNVGVVAGLGVFNTVSVHCKNKATVYGALVCLIAGDKLEIKTDGPAISASDTRRYNPCSLEQTDS